jgi:NAD+ kinase
VLGGDGTMLRALNRFLDVGVAALGVNFGRVGFLASIPQEQLEEGLRRAFAGEFRVVELPTLEVDLNGARAVAVNDVVASSSEVGRMVELAWTIGGEDLGRIACDGLICATPPGSTAYNLSNGGPVLVWGLDAMAVTFIAPHSLHARPLVVPRSLELVVTNETADVPVAVLTDGHGLGGIPPAGRAAIRLGSQQSLLAVLPEATFFRRYRQTFSHAP